MTVQQHTEVSTCIVENKFPTVCAGTFSIRKATWWKRICSLWEWEEVEKSWDFDLSHCSGCKQIIVLPLWVCVPITQQTTHGQIFTKLGENITWDSISSWLTFGADWLKVKKKSDTFLGIPAPVKTTDTTYMYSLYWSKPNSKWSHSNIKSLKQNSHGHIKASTYQVLIF